MALSLRGNWTLEGCQLNALANDESDDKANLRLHAWVTRVTRQWSSAYRETQRVSE